MRVSHLFALAAAILMGSPHTIFAQTSGAPCGDSVTVKRADTLSSIAERCDTGEAALLRANPGIEGSSDLQAGTQLRVRPGTATSQQTSDRLKALAKESGNALMGMAQELGSSVDDLLDKNPDLQQRLKRLGERFNIPGADAGKAQVSLSPESGAVGTAVMVSVTGAPTDTAVVIGGGAPGSAYEVLDHARTSPDGTLQATVRMPEWAGERERFVLTVAAEDGSWKVRSRVFHITGTKL